MDVTVVIVVAGVIVFGLVCARYGTMYLTQSRYRGSPTRSLPWWYIGGQPDPELPFPDDGGGSRHPHGPAPHASDASARHVRSLDKAEGDERVREGAAPR